MTELIRVGTRASALATTQSQLVAAAITKLTGCQTELVGITTHGDTATGSLASMGGTGVFVSALRDALLGGEIDVAVHSLKDIPTAAVAGITLVATPLREDPRDALIARDGLTLGELPVGSRVGTGSPRRRAQLQALGLGLDLIDIRGNVDTRIAKVTNGELDAVILARAGLNRLGRSGLITEVIDPLQILPAPGQGSLAVECRTGDPVQELLAPLDDAHTRACVEAERVVLAELEAGCAAPVGALAEVVEGEAGLELWIRAVALSPDGVTSVRRSASGSPDDAVGVGRKLAGEMLAEGAMELITHQMQESNTQHG